MALFDGWYKSDETSWGYKYNKNVSAGTTKVNMKTPKGTAWDLSFKTASAAIWFSLGHLVGDGLEMLPYLNTAIPSAVDWATSVDVAGNLDGLCALLGATVGAVKSGISLTDDRRLKSYNLWPVEAHVRDKYSY
jgi:hypothetical protein